jgi:catechol 2,3-dioxygenase-like lactoylglutathione lyase family enzyme
MLDHVSIGVSDIARAGRFYDAVLKPLGYTRLSDGDTALGYGDKGSFLWLLASKKPVKPDMESGLHFCFVARDRAGVDAFHAAALKQGGTDNGKPGVRTDYSPTYYAAFVIDPDGYRIEAYCGT